MTGSVIWCGQPVPFRPGETVASALTRAGIAAFGIAPTGQARAVFCGIGQCQGCLIRADGRLTEACLLPARDGLCLSPETGGENG